MMRIIEIKRMGYIPDYLYKEVQGMTDLIASQSDVLLFRGKTKGETSTQFNKTALVIAVLAFQPEGIEIFGFRFEATFPQPPVEQPLID